MTIREEKSTREEGLCRIRKGEMVLLLLGLYSGCNPPPHLKKWNGKADDKCSTLSSYRCGG
jgi:hypothetical protein